MSAALTPSRFESFSDDGFCSCGGRVLLDGVESYCAECGLVYASAPVAGSYVLPPEEDRAPLLLGARGASGIARYDYDAGRKPISHEASFRLRWTERRHRPPRTALEVTKQEVRRLVGVFLLPAPVARAAEKFAGEILDPSKPRWTYGAKIAAVVSVVLACRAMRVVVQIRDLAERSGTDAQTIFRGLRMASRDQKVSVMPTGVREHVEDLVRRLPRFPRENLPIAREYGRILESTSAGAGPLPRGLAAASVFVAAKGTLTKVSVSNAAGISEVSLRGWVRTLLEMRGNVEFGTLPAR